MYQETADLLKAWPCKIAVGRVQMRVTIDSSHIFAVSF